MKSYSSLKFVLILTPFVFSFAFGLDIYIPIIPEMSKIFDTSPGLVQLTMTLFLFTTGIGQLFVGPLADHFGRRAIFFLSAACFALGSLSCACSTHIGWLIASRILSSLGACGMLVTSFAVVRDLYDSEESARLYSFLNGAIGISPTFAPILGGYLAVSFGWQSVFLFLTCIGILAILVCRGFIEETMSPSQRIEMSTAIFKRYYGVFRNRQFLTYSTVSGLAEGVFFSFFSISPFLIIEELGVPTHQFGYYFACFGAVIGLGGLASGKVIERIGVRRTLETGALVMLSGGIAMLAWDYLEPLNLPAFLIPMVIACTGAMFLVGGSASLALQPFGAIAGTASAAFGAVQFGVSSLIGTLLMLFPTTSTVPYGTLIVLLSFLTFALLFVKHPQPEAELPC